MRFCKSSIHFKHYKTSVKPTGTQLCIHTYKEIHTIWLCVLLKLTLVTIWHHCYKVRVVYELLPSVLQRIMCHSLCLCEQHSCTTVMCEIVVGTIFNLWICETVIWRKVNVNSFHYPVVIKKSHASYIIQQQFFKCGNYVMLIDGSMIMNCGSGSPYLRNLFVFLYIFQENKKVSKFKYYV
jgi:hypothetical protein